MSTKIYIRPSELQTPVYQRSTTASRVNRIASSFDPDALGAVTVARRTDGAMVVIDGGHRVAACRKIEYDEKILAIVHDGLSLAEEARLFLSLNDAKTVHAVDKYRASVFAEDPVALKIEKIVTDRGWRVAFSKASGSIPAVAAIYRIIGLKREESSGLALLADTLTVTTNAWGHDGDGVQGFLIEGIAKVIHRYPEINLNRLTAVLSGQSPKYLRVHGGALADMSGWSKSAGVASTVTSAYNNKLRSGRLSNWIWKR